MKIVKTLSAALAALTVYSCATAQSPNYTLTVPLSEDEDGLTGYIIDYDNASKIDSAKVDNGILVFKGTIKSPVLAQLIVDGARMGTFILEPGDITADAANRSFSGTPLNTQLVELGKKAGTLQKAYAAIAQATDSTSVAKKKEIVDSYDKMQKEALTKNSSNPLGFFLFLQTAYEMQLQELDKSLNKYPAFAKSTRVKRLRDNLLKKEETSVGHKYKDFTITQPDGSKMSLSDYVGKGKYTLVDFWASWCGPCIRETKVIKEIYNKYADKGLEVLGVAVWDEPENTLKAVETHQLPWKQIINAQSIPTDIYGISGIPCIILFAPDGTIVSRDKQDADLMHDVEAAMNKPAE